MTTFWENIKTTSQPQLSNFYILDKPLIYDNKEFATCEHLFQCLRYLSTGRPVDLEYAEIIRKASTPTGAKMLGTQYIETHKPSQWKINVANTIRSFQNRGLTKFDHDHKAIDHMKTALLIKYDQNEEFRNTLHSTKGNITFWGNDFWGIRDFVIVAGRGPNAWRDTIGDNHLGKLLIEIRDNIH